MGEQADLIYNPGTKTWCYCNGKEIRKMARILDNSKIQMFRKNG